MNRKVYQRIILYIQVFSCLVLMGFVLINRVPDFKYYDESYYIRNLDLLRQYGLHEAFFSRLAGPAGPTHSFVHYIFYPLTGGEIPGIRYVNLFLLAGIIFFTAAIPGWGNNTNKLTGSLNYLFIPVTFVCCSLALTELPAMFFLLLSLLLLAVASRQIKRGGQIAITAVAAVCMSLAILGRQPYLLVVPVLVFLSLALPAKPFRPSIIILFAVISLIFPLYVFTIWGGWIPRGMTDYVDDGYSVKNAMIAFGLCGAFFLLLAPHWFAILQKFWKILIILGILFIATNYLFLGAEVIPFRGLLMKFDPVVQHALGRITGGVLIFAGIFFLTSLLARLWENRTDYWFVFTGLCMLGILLSCIKVTHMFSARYVYQAAPFIIFLVGRYRRFNLYTVMTGLACLFMGVAAMWFTFH